MIVKTSQRDRAAWLAAHLTRTDTNESVAIVGGRDVIALDVHLVLRQFEAQWRLSGSRARDFLVHAAISPAQPLSEEQWIEAWAIYEQQHGLHGQPCIEIEHGKPGDTGRPSHRHRVYLRIQADGRAIHLAFTHRVNEVVARLCELSFAHPLTQGAHNRAVVNYLERNGFGEEAGQLRGLTERRRPRAGRSEAEAQQESRSGSRKATAAECAAAAWRLADSPPARRAALAEAGFSLARGDRRDTVLAVDAQGEAWALHRLLAGGERGTWTAVRVRRDLEGVLDTLPSVEELRRRLREDTAPVEERPPCGTVDSFVPTPDSPSAERGALVVPAPMPEEADAYWPSDPADSSPALPTPAPVVCRLGASARLVMPDAADHDADADAEVRDVDGDASPPAPTRFPVPPSSATSAVGVKPPSDGRRVIGPSAGVPPTPTPAVAPAPGPVKADGKGLQAGAFASRRAVSKPEGKEDARMGVSPSPPPRRQPKVDVGRNAPASERSDPGSAAWDRPNGGIVPTTPSSGPAADRHVTNPPPLGKRWHEPGRFLELAARGSERAGDRDHRPEDPGSGQPSEETRRREAHNFKLAARRIRDLTAAAPRQTASTTAPAPAGMPPLPSDDPIMRLLASYAGALMDWWAARQRDRGDAADALRRRLDEAWRTLLGAARAWLFGNGAGGGAEQVQTLLTREIARSHQDARAAHAHWLDRMYPPSAAAVRVMDRTSEGAAPVGHRVTSRLGTGPERETTGP